MMIYFRKAVWSGALALAMLAVAMGLCAAADDPIQWNGRLEPAWLGNDDGDSTVGISFQGSAIRRGASGSVGLSVEGTLAADEARNPNPIVVDFKLLKIHDFYRPPTGVPSGGDADPFGDPDEAMAPADSSESGETQSAGDDNTIEYGVNLRFETDQERDNYGWAAGLEAAYISVSDISPEWPLNFSAYANIEWVDVLKSESRENLGIGENDYARVRAAASLKYKVGEHFSAPGLNPLGLHGDLRYYLDVDAEDELRDENLDTGLYWAGALSYELSDPNAIFHNGYVDAVFFRVSGGRKPPEPNDDTTFFLGIVVSTP